MLERGVPSSNPKNPPQRPQPQVKAKQIEE